MSGSAGSERGQSDWSPDQYLLFANARNRPIHDLITFLGRDYSPSSIIDLGCGPGNSTELLAKRFPNANISGVDSSPAMLAKARKTLPSIDFTQADLRTYKPPPGADLLFANAVFQWLRHDERISTITRLVRSLKPGGILALQMPDNYHEGSHRAMRDMTETSSLAPHFEHLSREQRPWLDEIEPPLAYYNALIPHCRAVETWTTRYVHALDDYRDIVEWVKGTGLQPYLNALPAHERVRATFLEEYESRLRQEYPRARDGKVLLAYPRRFVVAYSAGF
ncbi:S-adenosyl-L-methionine-dependent methyltransferase [Achaetomium macrosporum]|uniref:S-adenosyl-L-methionine-dependent methyltransferase n=1 Tax=Achaetomium macrosporum TaxID=79813 RepID=A0AAN7H693_9PEZI|nr:S-adenosyl-L-methionine-dependent methyltransferase [Achaetomium macrosporum]